MADLNDLTTLLAVQTYMADMSAATKALINAIGPGICAAIETFCDRIFALTVYKEKVWSQGGSILYLPQYPVVELRRIMRYSEETLKIQNTSTDAVSATVQVSQEQAKVYLNVIGGANASNQNVAIGANDMTALAAAIIAALKGWTAQVVGSNGALPDTELTPFAGADALSPAWAHCYMWKDPLTKLDLEPDRGRVEFKDGKFPNENYVWAEWSAGYATIPDDLALLATRLVATAVRQSKHDKGMKSEKWPDYSYTRKDLTEFCTAEDLAELERWRKFSL